MTYTEHKLTDAMLQRLSKINHGRNAGGMSTVALQSRGLIEAAPRHATVWWITTETGREALSRARVEGW